MARNEEKAQSMLYRFREAKAAELGVAGRSDKRPRMATSCKSLRDCERWRGEILREISRKVSKIQDMGLTDYEIRDLNDEINKLLREKRHWENQIIALGGANYRRNVAMLDSEGKEVPGTKGYKYFGRAKDLPGVKELFQKSTTEADEESQVAAYYRKYQGHGPAYYGDLDETNDALLEYEVQAEEQAWEDAYHNLAETLGLPPFDNVPHIPRPKPTALRSLAELSLQSNEPPPEKQNANADTDMEDVSSTQKRNAIRLPPLLSVLAPADVQPPDMPTKEEMEGVLLELRKRSLLEEYLGESSNPHMSDRNT